MVRGQAAWQSSELISLRPIRGISLRVRAEIATAAIVLLPAELYRLWPTVPQRLTRHACRGCDQYHLATVPLSIAPTVLASAASISLAVPFVPLRLSGVNTPSIMLRSSVESTVPFFQRHIRLHRDLSDSAPDAGQNR